MKRTVVFIMALCLLCGLCAAAEPAAPLALNDGVYWGMSSSGFAAAYGVIGSGSENITENDRVTNSFFDGPFINDSFTGISSLVGGLFIDDMLVCIGWDEIPVSYDYVIGCLTGVCGPATDSSSAHFSAIMDTLMNGSYISVYDECGFSGWQFSDGTYLAVFYYSETDLGVMYADEALMKLLLSDDSGAAAGETEDTAIVSGDAIPWGSSAETVIREMALDDYSDYGKSDGVYFIDIDKPGEHVRYVFEYDQLVCVMYEYRVSSEPLYTYDELLAEASSRSGEPTPDCGERILAIMNAFAPGVYSSADSFYDALGWELNDGSFMSLCKYSRDCSLLMITNEVLLFSLAAQ